MRWTPTPHMDHQQHSGSSAGELTVLRRPGWATGLNGWRAALRRSEIHQHINSAPSTRIEAAVVLSDRTCRTLRSRSVEPTIRGVRRWLRAHHCCRGCSKPEVASPIASMAPQTMASALTIASAE